MKPNKPIDRESLLRLIHESLDQATAAHAKSDASTSQNDGPLGLAVRQVMVAVSPKSNTSTVNNANSTPVPLFDVAAYIDGMLDDPIQVQAITDSAVSDPGLMMEIVSAVSAEQKPSNPSLSQDLRARLIGTMKTEPTALAAGMDRNRHDSKRPVVSATVSHQDQPATITLTPKPRPQSRPARSRMTTLALAATAAALLLAVGWWFGTTFGDRDVPIAKDNQVSTPNVPDVKPETKTNDEPILVESPTPSVDPIVIPRPEAEASPEPNVIDKMPVKNIAGDPAPTLDAAPGTTIEVPREIEPTKKATRLVAKWNQVDGLLLQSVSPPAVSASSSSSRQTLRSVSEGTTLELASSGADETLQLQTLPLCRASATLASGGELVLSTDTQIQLTSDGVINLEHGSLAFIASSDDSTIWLGKDLASSVPIQSHADATILVRKTVSGLQVDVAGSAVEIGEQTYSNSRLVIDDNLLAVRRVEEAPQRLPRWTRQRVDRIELGRTVLAQFASSNDIQATMMQTLRSGAVQGKSAATIRGWLVSSSGDNLIRMIISQDPLIRDAALRYLRTITPDDPRHQELWRRLQARSSNPRVFVAIRSYFVDLWANRRPDATRRDQLVRLVQSNDIATEVAANYLLTAFYGPGPRFQLGANANAKTRAVNAWRTIISRANL